MNISGITCIMSEAHEKNRGKERATPTQLIKIALETCGGCGYIYTHVYIYPYGTIGKFRTKQGAGLCQPTKHVQKHSLCSHLTVQNYTTTVYSEEKRETLYNRVRVDLKFSPLEHPSIGLTFCTSN